MAITVDIHEARIDNLLGTDGLIASRIYARGLRVRNRAKRLCPVDTGRLRSSIVVTPPYKRATEIIVSIGTNVEYAIFVHNGTRFMRARPFLTDALERET